MTEWYANGPLGLEQGFTLGARPAGRRAGPLTLSLAVSGNVRGKLSRRADAVTFTRPGVSLAYRGLIATDARGRQLPAGIELRDGVLLIRVYDRGARYPLRIDPFVQQAKLTASDGATNDFLGNSVAVDGNTVVAGAPGATVNGHAIQGAAYVFVKPAGGWANATETARLTASDGAAGDDLGISVWRAASRESGSSTVSASPTIGCANDSARPGVSRSASRNLSAAASARSCGRPDSGAALRSSLPGPSTATTCARRSQSLPRRAMRTSTLRPTAPAPNSRTRCANSTLGRLDSVASAVVSSRR
ncbi:MAG: hypothetical protein ACXVUE_07215 [Solirubrobacteraceae bacterium]